ncbi:MFS transporter [Variovorax arabinosiphilus]|uniref:MFS transporter n=1 Tax=Variovorax arabinosiphilus TaxID=3053498 RepID=UPI002578CD3B|nr:MULTISPECIES: MFS transporter [unclassified Variovorax]MDM0122657.1 MFS transporter [Variovorax sp. J2L1-78]MDM0132347.1 MFS transporter [Variovorax sp. J2L1-63]MDM0235420.1 MFS transporter [Variovorax sp. J2R1-6]
MSHIQATHTPAAPAAASALPASLVLLLATGAGLAVAALYYSQPMLGVLGADIGASARAVGFVPTLTQLGYALGILLLAPLGDRYDRRRIILMKAAVLCVALLLAGAAPSIAVLLVASLVIGLSATLAQDIVPAAATLAPEASRGKIVGTVMTGLLLGILLSRVVSGFVAEHLGWRTMFIAAALSIALIGAAAWRGLPRFRPTTQLSYGALMGSLVKLWKRHGALRRATLAQALLSIGFSAFWSTLAVMLHGEPFHLGSAAAGAFGLAGAAGALAAPIAGRIADKRGPELVTRLGASLVLASFAVMALAPWMQPHAQLGLLVVGAIGFDLGIQASLIAHQTIVYSIEPAARSRLNAVLFVGMFLGMAIGSALGALMLAQWGWMAVVGLAAASAAGALVVRLWPGAAQAH